MITHLLPQSKLILNIVTSACTIFTCVTTAIGQASFDLIPGSMPGRTTSIRSITPDGRLAVGTMQTPIGFATFTWSRQTGRVDIPTPAGFNSYAGVQTTSDGSTIVGYVNNYEGMVITNNGVHTVIPPPSGSTFAAAAAVAGNGSALAVNFGSTTVRAGRYKEGDGYTELPQLSLSDNYIEASAMSRDGSTVIGRSGILSSSLVASGVVWRLGRPVQALEGLIPDAETMPAATTPDGSIIVGASLNASIRYQACYWDRAGNVFALPTLEGYLDGLVSAVTDNGNLIVGSVYAGPVVQGSIWNVSTGQVSLFSDYIAQHGLRVPDGYLIEKVTSVSADGTVFGGYARRQGGGYTAFMVTIPAPGPLVGLGIAAALASRRRR